MFIQLHSSGIITRRSFLQSSTAMVASAGAMSLLAPLGLNAEELKKQGKSCILVFLNGAPSQMETWDPKPGQTNGGPTKGIDTAIAGVQFAEYWPKLAASMKDLSVIRSLSGKEAAHERGQYHLRTGHRLAGATKFPHFGSIVAHKLGSPESDIPNFVSIGNTLSSGFLGVKVAPFIVNKPGQLPENVSNGAGNARMERRLGLLKEQDAGLATAGAEALAKEHEEIYGRAAKLMTSVRLKAFDIASEPDAMKQAYGANQFGQGCLAARRLVEAGVPFVEVQRGGWDMHESLWEKMGKTAPEVDQGVAQLIADLKQRGLYDKTLVIVMGEFGRTPKINQRNPAVGRDHWARNFSLLIGGGGIQGGVCVGKTSDDGATITDRQVEVDDLFQTMAKALGINAAEELITPEGRPVRIVDKGTAISDLV
jgi:uncharacterized protein (DUF1501 family)